MGGNLRKTIPSHTILAMVIRASLHGRSPKFQAIYKQKVITMKIGCPTEIKPQEFRVGLTPSAALEAVNNGHDVIVQSGAGIGAGFDDSAYESACA